MTVRAIVRKAEEAGFWAKAKTALRSHPNA
jgi:hypothetical protein